MKMAILCLASACTLLSLCYYAVMIAHKLDFLKLRLEHVKEDVGALEIKIAYVRGDISLVRGDLTSKLSLDHRKMVDGLALFHTHGPECNHHECTSVLDCMVSSNR